MIGASVFPMERQSVYAVKPYWTPIDRDPGKGMTAYHLFLNQIFPSYVDRHIRLLNQNLSVCLDFSTVNYTDPAPLCHKINESDIPNANDSIMDVGFFVVSDRLNGTNAGACLRLGYHNWYICNGQTIDSQSFYAMPKILENMGPTYDDVFVNDACLNYHHLKEGTPEFHDCEKGLS